ncbi:hypothetical protein MIZ01_1006 [Sideroxyarcus emersonii]|uniref:Pentapeptide repeat-containing protein n=1 Tax=Sideroxyarcus emersonii TaxID=2764705 RepID=A0AAN2BYK4_9PROT|nr:pentapeptide repeat-containing protein [Sideroxyarcus emersonii]BCK87234.1 hypothetical protein MIZ01_1006 [Sideroxyarcus emersonii]
MKKVNSTSITVGLFFSFITIMGSATAVPLPKGNCADPKPYTDLRHCRFEGKDLSNKDLRGTDLRVASLYLTDLQGANLTKALFDRNKLLLAELDGAQGLPKEILDTLRVYSAINDRNYLVTHNGNSNITLTPHEAVDGIQENIVGLANIQMVMKVENQPYTIALFDWPRNNDYKGNVIIARFDNDKFEMPACYRGINLMNRDSHYNADWTSMKVMALANGGYLIGIRASGGDGDEMDISGWDMVAFFKLTSNCNIVILHKEESGWLEKPDHTGCQGVELDFSLLDEQTAETISVPHTCSVSDKFKEKVSYKKIKLN